MDEEQKEGRQASDKAGSEASEKLLA